MSRSTPAKKPLRHKLRRAGRELVFESAPPHSPDHVPEFSAATVGSSEWHRSQASLRQLYDLFPDYDRDFILTVYESLNHNWTTTLEYILAESHQAAASSPALHGASGSLDDCSSLLAAVPKRDYLSNLPLDTLLIVLDGLSLLDLCMLGRTCQTLHSVVRDRSRAVASLDLSPYRTFTDSKLLSMLSQFPNLSSLSMRNCKDFRSFQSLSSCASSVARLNLTGCEELDEEGLQCIVAFIPSLASLTLSNTYVSDGCLELLADAAPPVQALNLSGCHVITDSGVCRVINRLRTLETLDLKDTMLTGDGFKAVRARSQALKRLSLQGCTRVFQLELSPQFSPTLEHLNLSGMPKMSRLTLSLPNLETLNVTNCQTLSVTTLRTPKLKEFLMAGCVQSRLLSVEGSTLLETIDVSRCRNLTIPAFRSLITSAASSLLSLTARACLSLEDETARYIYDRCAKMLSYDIAGCKGVSHLTHVYLTEAMRIRARQAHEAEVTRLAAVAAEAAIALQRTPSAQRTFLMSLPVPVSPVVLELGDVLQRSGSPGY